MFTEGNWHEHKDPGGVVWLPQTLRNSLNWLVPKKVRMELIQYVHDQGHFEVDKVLEKIKDTGW